MPCEFSILIPMSRPELVRDALDSLARQTIKNFEVVIANNSQTQFAVNHSRYGFPIKVFDQPRRLDVTENWSQLLTRAKAPWVIYLCDDDLLVSTALETLSEIANAYPETSTIAYSFAMHYPAENHVSKHLQNTLVVPRTHTGKVEFLTKDSILTAMYRSGTGFAGIKSSVPFFPMAAVKTSVVTDCLRTTDGIPLTSWCPMIASASMMLTWGSELVVRLDSPLVILGNPAASAGSVDVDDETYRSMHKNKSFRYVPIHNPLNFASVTAESFLANRYHHAPTNEHRDCLLWSAYFKNCLSEYLTANQHRGKRLRGVMSVFIAAKRANMKHLPVLFGLVLKELLKICKDLFNPFHSGKPDLTWSVNSQHEALQKIDAYRAEHG